MHCKVGENVIWLTSYHGRHSSACAHNHAVAILEAQRLQHEAQGRKSDAHAQARWRRKPRQTPGQQEPCAATGRGETKTGACLRSKTGRFSVEPAKAD